MPIKVITDTYAGFLVHKAYFMWERRVAYDILRMKSKHCVKGKELRSTVYQNVLRICICSSFGHTTILHKSEVNILCCKLKV